MEQTEEVEDLANRAQSLVTIDDTRMSHAIGMKPGKVIVVGNDHPRVGKRERDVFDVPRAQETGFDGGRHVDSPLPQPLGDRVGNMLVKMEAYWGQDPAPSSFAGAATGSYA